MHKTDAHQRILKLKAWLKEWNYKYFVLSETEVSEGARDKIKRELEELEKEFPEFVTADSPTQRVGSALDSKFAKIRHLQVKQSLADCFSAEELLEWEERIKRVLPGEKFDYISELKIDGLNVSLIYEKGKLHRALTRGDGVYGEDVTHTVRTIETVPLELLPLEGTDLTKYPVMEVSGEVFMSKKNSHEFANPRNAAAGTVRQLDPRVAARRKVEMVFYSLLVVENGESEPMQSQK